MVEARMGQCSHCDLYRSVDKDGNIDLNVQIPLTMIAGLAGMDGRAPADCK
jgi:hypothetical protein